MECMCTVKLLNDKVNVCPRVACVVVRCMHVACVVYCILRQMLSNVTTSKCTVCHRDAVIMNCRVRVNAFILHCAAKMSMH